MDKLYNWNCSFICAGEPIFEVVRPDNGPLEGDTDVFVIVSNVVDVWPTFIQIGDLSISNLSITVDSNNTRYVRYNRTH